jgi:hypothetical protein
MDFKTFCESTYDELYAATVTAFPKTKLRQHATGPVQISEVKFTPFVGVKTLFLRARATNEDREYSPMILFKGVNYVEATRRKGIIRLKISRKESRYIEQLVQTNSEMLVRCDCKDFSYRFRWYDWLDRSLYGHQGRKYEGKGGPPANPKEMPGMCKHLLKMFETLKGMGLVVDGTP